MIINVETDIFRMIFEVSHYFRVNNKNDIHLHNNNTHYAFRILLIKKNG